MTASPTSTRHHDQAHRDQAHPNPAHRSRSTASGSVDLPGPVSIRPGSTRAGSRRPASVRPGSLHPGSLRSLLKMGDSFRKAGELELAIDAYEEVADCYREAGRLKKALVVYRHVWGIVRMHRLARHHVRIATHLGAVAAELDNNAEALAAYDAAATRLREHGRADQALDVYHAMHALEPNNPLVSLRLAECYALLGKVGAAVPLLGYAAIRMRDHGHVDQAIMVLERLLDLKQDAAYARLAAELYLHRGGKDDGVRALKRLQIAHRAAPTDLIVLELLACAFDVVGQPMRATTVRGEAARIAIMRESTHDVTPLPEPIVSESGERSNPTLESIPSAPRSINQNWEDSDGGYLVAIDGEITELLSRSELQRLLLDEDALWTADDLAYDGRYAEARVILEGLMRQCPHHALVLEALERVDRLALRRRQIDAMPEACPLPPSSRRPESLRDSELPAARQPAVQRGHDTQPMSPDSAQPDSDKPQTVRHWPPPRRSDVASAAQARRDTLESDVA